MSREPELGPELTPSPPASLFPATLISDSQPDISQTDNQSSAGPVQAELAPADNNNAGTSLFVAELVSAPKSTGVWRTALRWLGNCWHYTIVAPLQLACLVILLALISVVPVLQLASLGYFFEVSGRLGRGGRIRDSLILLTPASRLVMALLAIYLVAQPIRLVTYWAYTAELLSANNPQTATLRTSAWFMVVAGMIYLSWAWVRGGRLRDYLWPQPVRFLREAWRPTTWSSAGDRFWEFLGSFQFPKLFWLGLRGGLATLVWITLPALLIVGATRNGETGLAGLVGLFGLATMGFVVLYLPMLQAQFATENSWRAMFAWRRTRRAFAQAPIAYWLGTSATLLFAIPLYLLKIEATPKEVVWLPALFFIAFMLPAHVLTGWAMGRAGRQTKKTNIWNSVLRMTCRLLTLPVVVAYLLFVSISQLTSWDGLATWFQQHAFLVPVPFTGT
ncbi:DUF4013 domain-containing protein [Planctomycetaceae bacterium SH139]